MKPLHPFSALRGVTLTEVMIVIAIIGILAGIAVPSYTDMINRNKVKQAAESLADDLKFARTEAIKRNCNVTLSFTSDASAYQITPEAGTGSCLAGVTQATIKTIDISSTGQFPGVTFASTKKATFDFRRGIADVADIAIVSKSNFSATVSVNLAGMIKICSSTIPGYSC